MAGIKLSRQAIGLLSGLPLFFLLLWLPRPAGMSPEAQKTLAVAIFMGFWWITEALPIPVTALLPLVLFPVLNLCPAGEAALRYSDKNIFLFMGGFFLAASIEKWNLHRRIALHALRILGCSPQRIVFGIMATTALISMWISNTATAMLMLPIALALVKEAEISQSGKESPQNKSFGLALLFGIGYGASIGGIGTLIGTPPNIILATQLGKIFPGAPEISFFDWMLVGFPLVILFIPISWLYLTRIAFPMKNTAWDGGRDVINSKLKALGRISAAERSVLIIFVFTALGWIFRRDITVETFTLRGWAGLLGIGDSVHDSTVAIAASLLLFAVPANLKSKKPVFLLDWKSARTIPWGILLLFGGGLALASQFQDSGLTVWIAANLGGLNAVPVLISVIIIVLLIDFLTEITSNTAVTTLFLPVLAALAVGLGTHPLFFMIAGTIAASLAFMLPVATPPNAVIFSSGRITIPQMARTGLVMNLLGVIVTTVILYLFAIPVFRITINTVPIWAQ